MATSIRQFNIGLYVEHLDEAAFLYSQRQALLKSDELPWAELASFEERLEAHLDALVIGGELALRHCMQQLVDNGEPGLLFAAVSVFCRQRRSDLLAEALKHFDHANPAMLLALAHALRWDMPVDWTPFVERALARGDERLVDALASVAGYRRLDLVPALLQAHAARPSAAVAAALGRLRSTNARPALESGVVKGDTALKTAALLALVQTGSIQTLRAQYLSAQVECWPRHLLALAGDAAASEVLVGIVHAGKATPDCLLALGLLGDLPAMRTLFRCLTMPEFAGAAALGLNWATGANLFEAKFEPDEVKEDELFESELLVWREQRRAPMRLDGQLFGKQVQALSTDPEVWKQWLDANMGGFDAQRRYRHGAPYSPATLVETLRDPRSDCRLRRFSGLELQIRYGCDAPFETDMPVRLQLGALLRMDEWLQQHAQRFVPGGWYFNGQSQ